MKEAPNTADRKARRRSDIKKLLAKNTAVVAFILVFVFSVALKGSVFFSTMNIVNILRSNSIIGIIALAMTLIIITGGIDLSVGSQLVIIGIAVLAVTNATGSIILGALTGMVLGVVLGSAAGSLVAKFKIPAFIVTLGTMGIYRAVSQYLLNGGGIMIAAGPMDNFVRLANYDLFGVVPMTIIYWLLACAAIHVLATRTQTGRYIYSVGSNEKATLLSGINTDRVKIAAYSIAGLLVAFAAIIESSRLGSINSSSSGASYEMDAIAAAVVGGTSMSGGKGTILGTICGALTLGVINNMMTLLGVPPFLVGAVKGAIIICAVLLQKVLGDK
jgi:ribose transport system permease protein